MECKTCNYGQLILMATSKVQYVALCNNFRCSQAFKIGDNIKAVKILEFDEKLKYHKLKVGWSDQITFNKNHKTRAEKPFEGFVFDDEEYKGEIVDMGKNIFTPSRLVPKQIARSRRATRGEAVLEVTGKGINGIIISITPCNCRITCGLFRSCTPCQR